MAKSKNQIKKISYISVPSQIINSLSSSSLQSLLISPKKSSPNNKTHFLHSKKLPSFKNPRLWLSALIFMGIIGMLKLGINLDRSLLPFPSTPCQITQSQPLISSEYSDSDSHISIGLMSDKVENFDEREKITESQPLVSSGYLDDEKEKITESQALISNGYLDPQMGNEKVENFWRQPDGLGYKPCLGISEEYRRESVGIVKDRSKYLVVVVAGGMNQQRNQIVDAVVIARILGAALVVPILQVNVIWGDESEFSDIFDMEHFKRELADDVRIVSSLPSTHLMSRPVEEKRTPLHVSPRWIRQRYLGRMRREGVLLLRGLDSRLSKDLPSDLQKLRCKVAFHALRFAPPILELGNKLAERMRSKGPYLALHLRMEKDVWVRTGCLPGLSQEYDEIIHNERKLRPELLTGRSNMSYHERKLAGLCPLNAMEVTRLLKALGAPRNAKIYWAGGQPFGGKEALDPLISEFPNFFNKEDLALPGELEPFENKASVMASIDYIVSENSDVFMPSHGGNMGHAIQGHRAYAGHRKYITPNKRQMLPYFLNSSLPEAHFKRIIMKLHMESLGQPELRTSKVGRDVTKYPIPECMCNDSSPRK